MKSSWLIPALLIPLVILGWMRLRFETDILATLPADVPEVRAVKLLRAGFTGGSNLVIGLEAEDDFLAEEAANSLGRRLEKESALASEVRWARPMEEQAETGSALLAWMLQNAAPDEWAKLRARLEGDGAKVQVAKAFHTVGHSLDAERVQRASYDPLGLMDALSLDDLKSMGDSSFGLASEDGRFRLLLVTPMAEVGNYKDADRWLRRVWEIVDVWKVEEGFEECTVRFTGEPAFQSEVGMGIEEDMSGTMGLTAGLIGLLFWLMFRRLKLLLWIQILLALSMVTAIGLGGLLVGRLSMMSLGFAAIVMGIIVDYAVLILQEARQHPHLPARALRRLAAPGILAGAATTAAVFVGLTLCSLPGMAEMGLLVALGVLSGLVVMIGLMPLVCAGRGSPEGALPIPQAVSHRVAAVGTVLLLLSIGGALLLLGAPEMERKVDALRPRNSEAMAAFQWVQERLGRSAEASVPVLLTGPMQEMKQRAKALDVHLREAVKKGILVRQAVPLPLVYDAEAQRANRPMIEWLLAERARLELAIGEVGFADAAMGLLRGLCGVWEKVGTWPQMPSESAALPVLGRILSAADGVNGLPEGGGILMTSVSVPGMPGHPDRANLEELRVHLLPLEGSFVAGWEMLSTTLSRLAQADLAVLLPPVVLLLLVTLFLVFRNVRDVLLSVLSLCAGVAALMATMSVLGQSWNLASLAAIPLLLGTGIDYSIHILLALRRSGNDIRHVRATTGRAVFFAGMTTVIGFSSLIFANNRGLSALGLACCAGVLWVLLFVLWLLPHWRAWMMRKGEAYLADAGSPPSST